MKKFTIQALLLILAITTGIYLYSKGSSTINIPFLPQKPILQSLQINDKKLNVEVADTQSKRSKGLGGRTTLAEDEGMLFIFEKADKYPFWMKGLSFPLDFVWIREDKVVDILTNIPPPQAGQRDETLPIYQPKEPVDKVLEVNAGTADKLKIKVGDTIKLE